MFSHLPMNRQSDPFGEPYEDRDYSAMIEKFMEENIEQFEEPESDNMDDFKPIFMIGPCRMESEETAERPRANRITVFDKEKGSPGLEKIDEVSGQSSVLNQSIRKLDLGDTRPQEAGLKIVSTDLDRPAREIIRENGRQSRRGAKNPVALSRSNSRAQSRSASRAGSQASHVSGPSGKRAGSSLSAGSGRPRPA